MTPVLPIRSVAKPWGKDTLPPPFTAAAGERIGEIWFEPPEALPELLVKYIFTSEALSVQVHPSDAQTMAQGLGRQGKEECWLVIDAEPGAVLGIGFKAEIGAEAMRAAALDGSIEQLMVWHPVAAGDFLPIGDENLDDILSYVANYLTLKCGGNEFKSTMTNYDQFMKAVATRKGVNAAKISYFEPLFGFWQREQGVRPDAKAVAQ